MGRVVLTHKGRTGTPPRHLTKNAHPEIGFRMGVLLLKPGQNMTPNTPPHVRVQDQGAWFPIKGVLNNEDVRVQICPG